MLDQIKSLDLQNTVERLLSFPGAINISIPFNYGVKILCLSGIKVPHIPGIIFKGRAISATMAMPKIEVAKYVFGKFNVDTNLSGLNNFFYFYKSGKSGTRLHPVIFEIKTFNGLLQTNLVLHMPVELIDRAFFNNKDNGTFNINKTRNGFVVRKAISTFKPKQLLNFIKEVTLLSKRLSIKYSKDNNFLTKIAIKSPR